MTRQREPAADRHLAPADGESGPTAAQALLVDNGIDDAWLTAALNEAGVPGWVVDVAPTLVGTGQVGENVRCHLTWSSDEGQPPSVVLKLPSSNEQSRAAAAATRTYIREVGFYRDVAGSVAIRVPRTFHIGEDRDASRFVLLMEDVTPARAGDQLAGCTADEAGLAIDAAADLHGSTWGRAELRDLDWVDEPSPARAADRSRLYRACHQGFVERYGSALTADELAVGHWLADNFEPWTEARDHARCLVHGDFRPDNMLFGIDGSAPPLTTVDWQTVTLGSPMSDVAYFLSGALDPPVRRRHQRALLARYRQRLNGHGVPMSESEARDEYRLASPAGYVMAVIASQLVGQTERGDEMFLLMARGSAELVRETGLLPGASPSIG